MRIRLALTFEVDRDKKAPDEHPDESSALGADAESVCQPMGFRMPDED